MSAINPLRLFPLGRRVRAFFAGKLVADSRKGFLMLEPGHLPTYYLPQDAVDMRLLVASFHESACPWRGAARYWSIQVGDRTVENAAWNYRQPVVESLKIERLICFKFDAFDSWFEEEDEVLFHPRDPFHSVEIRQSTQHVVARMDGVVVAESHRPVLVFESDLPVRYYLPRLDVRMDLLRPSATTSGCPYKGLASYWSLVVNGAEHPDLVWSYPHPLAESLRLAGLLSFYDERLELTVED